MTVKEYKLYKILPKVGYIFHSLELEDVYSDCLYSGSSTSFGSWEEVVDPEAKGTADNPFVYTGKDEDGIDNAFYYDEKSDKTYVYMSGEYIEM